MKKVLLGTSALALAGAIVTPAAAAEWDMVVGGYFESYAAFGSTDFDDDRSGDWDGIDSKQDAEIHFKPSITLDNGIKFGADIQLEGNTSGDQIDESYIFIRGSFGELNFGNENSAGYKMTYAAPDVTFVNANSGSLNSFIPFSGKLSGSSDWGKGNGETGSDLFRGTLGSTFLENAGNNDAARFTYYTPRFAGFQLGLSYARDGNDDSNTQIDTDTELHDFFDVGANYVNTFGDISIAISGRYGIADAPSSGKDPQVWAFGGNLGFAGFTVGGSYGEQDDTGSLRKDGRAWDVGASYTTGPWGFSFTYFNGKNKDNGTFYDYEEDEYSKTPVGGDETLEQWLVGVSYSMAKGVTLNGFGAYVDFEEDHEKDNLDGFVIGTGIKLSF